MFWFIIPLILVLVLIILIRSKFNRSQYGTASGNSLCKTIFDKGLCGEYLTFCILEKLEGNNKLLVNIYVPKDDGSTTEVDLLMICPTGIYVFESKNYGGWIYGSDKSKNWTQTLNGGREKNKFFNPVWQNKAHVNALNRYLCEVDRKCYHSYIVFSDRCEFKSIDVATPDVTVLKQEDLEACLKGDILKRPVVLVDDQITEIYERLADRTLVDDFTKEQHIREIQSKL